MPYELAKQLKEAGFPQKEPLLLPPYQYGDDVSQREAVYFPTLSELIEACGDDLVALQREDPEYTDGFEWCAVKDWEEFYPPSVNKGECGHTPEEAVAKLWLSLHG